MSDYRIVCTDKSEVNPLTHHTHIVGVGIDLNNDGNADDRRTKQEVIDDIRMHRNRYYTIGNVSGKLAWVEIERCVKCGYEIIRTVPDDVRDNNLDNLRLCSWK